MMKQVPTATRVSGEHVYTDERGTQKREYETQMMARSTNPNQAADVARAIAAETGEVCGVVDIRTGNVISVAGVRVNSKGKVVRE